MNRLFAAALLMPVPLPALAHHPMGGYAPQTAWQGLLSGFGHPVIGVDHLAFLIGAGLLAAMLPWRTRLGVIGGFVGAGAVGTLLHLSGFVFGPIEALVAATSVLAGLVLLIRSGGAPRPAMIGPCFALAGLVHGHAFAEAVVGAEATPVAAYLIGLALTQGALALGVAALAQDAGRLRRPAGAVVAAFGAVALALALSA